MSILRPVVLVLLPLESTLLRWRLLPRTLPGPIWLSFSRTCFREKSWVSIRHWCIGYPFLLNPVSIFMFILCLLSKFFSGVSPRSGFTLIPHRLVTESVFWPASTLKPPPVFRCRQLPYHLVQRCCHRSANCPGTLTSRWDRPFTLRPVDIGASFPSPPPFHQVNICHGYHHANLCIGAYNHPHHKLRFPVPQYSMARGTRQCRQESSLKRCGYRPCSPPGQGIVWGGGLAQQCPSISLILAVGTFMTPSMPIHSSGLMIPTIVIKA